MEKEIWKAVEGFEGFYEVSNMGRVKALRREVPRNVQCKQIPEKRYICI